MNLLSKTALYIGVPVAMVFSILTFFQVKGLKPNVAPMAVGSTVSIAVNMTNCAGGSCTCNLTSGETYSSGGVTYAVVHSHNYVQWIANVAGTIDVTFDQHNSPFYDFLGTPGNPNSTFSGQAMGTDGETYPYTGLKVGANSCNNVGSFGIIMREP